MYQFTSAAAPETHILDVARRRFIRLSDHNITVLDESAIKALWAIAKDPAARREDQAFLAGMTVPDFNTSIQRARLVASRYGDNFFERKIIPGTKGSFRIATSDEVDDAGLRKPEWVFTSYDPANQIAINIETGVIHPLTDEYLPGTGISPTNTNAFKHKLRDKHEFPKVVALNDFSQDKNIPSVISGIVDKFNTHLTLAPAIRIVPLPQARRGWGDHGSSWVMIIDFTKNSQDNSPRIRTRALSVAA